MPFLSLFALTLPYKFPSGIFHRNPGTSCSTRGTAGYSSQFSNMTRQLAFKAHLFAPVKRLPDFSCTNSHRALYARSRLNSFTEILSPTPLVYILHPFSLGLECTNNIKSYQKVTT